VCKDLRRQQCAFCVALGTGEVVLVCRGVVKDGLNQASVLAKLLIVLTARVVLF